MQLLLGLKAQSAAHHDLLVLSQILYLMLCPNPPALPEQMALGGETVRASASFPYEQRRVGRLAQLQFKLVWV